MVFRGFAQRACRTIESSLGATIGDASGRRVGRSAKSYPLVFRRRFQRRAGGRFRLRRRRLCFRLCLGFLGDLALAGRSCFGDGLRCRRRPTRNSRRLAAAFLALRPARDVARHSGGEGLRHFEIFNFDGG